MNRREAIGRALGLPLALAGVTAVKLSTPLRLDSSNVRVNLTVFDDGDGPRVTFTLLEKPWPKVGDQVQLAYEDLQLQATVTAWHTETIGGSDRVFYHVGATVQAFDAKPARDEAGVRHLARQVSDEIMRQVKRGSRL